MISVTERAEKQILKLIEECGINNPYLRVDVKGGGCSGLSYSLGFVEIKEETDQLFENNSIKILISKKSFLYLIGTELDYTDGLNGKGFQFINPNATRTCGCGESFAV
jgi:iron-sulfur cluster assembly protein